jgi:hypothetical protein
VRPLLIIAILAIGCGGSKEPAPSAAPAPAYEMDAGAGDTAAWVAEVNEDDLTAAVWQNGSCGDRKYVRKLTFNEDGTFTARDEVAPCPEGRDQQCVSSGVIDWQGRWTLAARTIRIEVEAGESGRLPDQVPDAFVVLSDSPLAIGEKRDRLVCPYRNEK